MRSMISPILVISWWSNCMALTCLHRLRKFAAGRELLVVQVGKKEELKTQFRKLLPQGVREILIDPGYPADHWMVLEKLAGDILKMEEGIWFWDHDLFLEQDAAAWLSAMDEFLSGSLIHLLYPEKRNGGPITHPAFWLSPRSLQETRPGFAPVPLPRGNAMANTPFLTKVETPALTHPQKDTLVACMEYLSALGKAHCFEVDSFPRFRHLGGLYLLAYSQLPPDPFLFRMIQNQISFFQTCPQEWLDSEDPVILERLRDLSRELVFTRL